MADTTATEAVSGDSDQVAGLKARLAELEADLENERNQATDYMKKWQYAQAELANMRRRHQQERDDLTKFAVAPLAGGLLEVLDNFDRAEQSVPTPLHSFTWITGVFYIRRQVEYFLEQQGVERISTENAAYDPTLHEAMTHEAHESVPAGQIIAEVQRGYRLHGRLLRPALVRVSTGPAPAADADASAASPEAAEAGAPDA